MCAIARLCGPQHNAEIAEIAKCSSGAVSAEIKSWNKEIAEGKEQKLDHDIPPPLNDIINADFELKPEEPSDLPLKPLDIVRY